MGSPRILLADASRYHARLVERELRNAFHDAAMSVVHTGAAALGEIQRTRCDVVIVSEDSDRVTAQGILAGLSGEIAPCAIVVLSDSSDTAIHQRLLQAGAAHVLQRHGAYLHLLPRVLVDVMRRAELRQDIAKLERFLGAREHAEIVGIVTGTLAHEINNPLMTILGVTELLLSSGAELPRDLHTKIATIEDSARRIEQALKTLTTLEQPRLRLTESGGLLDTRTAAVRA